MFSHRTLVAVVGSRSAIDVYIIAYGEGLILYRLMVGHTINSAFILHLTGNVQYWCWTHDYSAFKLHSTGNLQYKI